MKPYRVLIIGGGQIGALYNAPDSLSIRSHAHSFTKHPRFVLHGIVETNAEQRQKIINRWGCAVFESLDEAGMQFIDVAVVAVPDPLHYSLLKKLAELTQQKLRLVIAEKPLTKTLEQAEDILDLYRNRNIPLCVNYTRRFAPGFSMLQKQIRRNEFGKLLQGTGYYGKGIVHNGSHLIDLLLFLFGKAEAEKTFAKVYDFYEDDPTVSAVLRLGEEHAPFVLQGVDCRHFTIFESDFLFEKRRIRMLNSGEIREEYCIEPSKEFSGYNFLCKKSEQETQLYTAMYNVADCTAQFLDNGTPLPSTGESAFSAQKLCDQL